MIPEHFPDLEVKADSAGQEQYVYPLDEKTTGTYMADKKEVATYFKNVYATDMVYRACNGLNKWQISQLNDLEIELMCVICAEAASRIFPTRQVYDAAVKPYYQVLKNGGAMPGSNQNVQAEQWRDDNIQTLFEQMKASMLNIQQKFKSGVQITDGVLYPDAALVLLYARCIYHRLLMNLITEDPSVLSGGNEQQGAAPAGNAHTEAAPAEAAPATAGADLSELKFKADVLEATKRLSDMADALDKYADKRIMKN